MFDKLFIQRTYAEQIGPRLERFNVQTYSPYRAIFRCPICGDSQKSKFKRRGYFLEKDQNLFFYCHNGCGSMNFEKFMENYHPDLYTQYKFEIIQEYKQNKKIEKKFLSAAPVKPKTPQHDYLEGLINVRDNDQARQYLLRRNIPERFFSDIFYTEKFYDYVNDQGGDDKFPESFSGRIDKRIILPMRTREGEIFGIIGRSIEPNPKVKYLTIRFIEEIPKFFGLERLDFNKPIYIAEGPIDSYFLDNSGAFAGTDGSPRELFEDKQRIIVLDNQPRNIQVINKYQKYIDQGEQIVIWPNDIKEKDINDMVINNIDVNEVVKQNTYQGLRAKIQLQNWRRI